MIRTTMAVLAILIAAFAVQADTVVSFVFTGYQLEGDWYRCTQVHTDSVTRVRFYGAECLPTRPFVVVQPGCQGCYDEPNECSPGVVVTYYVDQFTYNGTYWETVLDVQSSGCVCISPDMPLSDPPGVRVQLDPVTDLLVPHCVEFFESIFLTIGPGLSHNQVPVLTVQNGCDATTPCNGSEPPNPLDTPHIDGPYYCENDASFHFHIYEWTDDFMWDCLTLDHILPVEFGQMSLVPHDGTVEVEWNTLSETRVDHFELQRDGAAIHTVTATNTATEHHYSYEDRALENGRNYRYELFVVNADGSRQSVASGNVTPNANAAVITGYALHQNYPNPFNPTTSIAIDLAEKGNVTLKVYNLMGQVVANLVSGNVSAGRHIVSFDASKLSSGVYLYRLSVNGFVAEKKMLLMK